MRTALTAAAVLLVSGGILSAADGLYQGQTFIGTVDSVNPGQNRLSVTDPRGNRSEYTLPNDTEITTRDGSDYSIGDLRPGSKVAVTYTGTKDNPVVTRVEAQ